MLLPYIGYFCRTYATVMEGDAVLNISDSEVGKDDDFEKVYEIMANIVSACDKNNFPSVQYLLPKIKNITNQDYSQFLNRKSFSSNAKCRRDLKEDILKLIVNKSHEEFSKRSQNSTDLLFFAAVKFQTDELRTIIGRMSEEAINETKIENNVVLFLLKYGDCTNMEFLETVRILIDANVNLNQFDNGGKFAIDYVAELYRKHKNEDYKILTELLLQHGIYEINNKNTKKIISENMAIDLKQYQFLPINEESQLFLWIINDEQEQFLQFPNIRSYINAQLNGTDTLLQLACKKSDNMKPIVDFLLKNGAEVAGITRSNNLTPLEIAGRRNHEKIFKTLILEHKKYKIPLSEAQFNNFLHWRGKPMDLKFFRMLLESDLLDPNCKSDSSQNTPLHYAIMFRHRDAVMKLLKNGASLLVKNAAGKCALDLMHPEDLERYFDSCIIKDNHKDDISDPKYKIQLDFRVIRQEKSDKELKLVGKIAKNSNLQNILKHPFIHTIISLKWAKSRIYLYMILLVQFFIYACFSYLFYYINTLHTLSYVWLWSLILVNVILKLSIIFSTLKVRYRVEIWGKTVPLATSFFQEEAPLHFFFEIALIITTICIVLTYDGCRTQFRAFVFLEMAISFLLTAGYHPRLAKWSIMTQTVFKTFGSLFLFYSLIIFGFSIGFQILFQDDKNQALFGNVLTAIFKTYIMTTGEFEVNDIDFRSHIGAFCLLLLFAIGVSLVIVNFLTGVAVTDIERIEKHSEINASRNIVVFLYFVEAVYCQEFPTFFRRFCCCPSPLLFSRARNTEYKSIPDTKKSNLKVDFYINKGNGQFEAKYLDNFPSTIDARCSEKIRQFLSKNKINKEDWADIDRFMTIWDKMKNDRNFQINDLN